jgi:deazaflavin-dependent oxidoreductase (nitroreductase family)
MISIYPLYSVGTIRHLPLHLAQFWEYDINYETIYIYALEEDRMSNQINWNKAIIDEFRANSGKVGGPFAGKTLLLLHTVEAKSGQERVNPVAYVRDGDRIVIIASKGGAPNNPDWYHNILAHPLVTVEVGTEQFQARAATVSEPERTRIYNLMVAMMPGFAEYQQKTTRVIPVMALTRVR